MHKKRTVSQSVSQPVSQSVSQELFDHSNADENFLKNVTTGDETWIYGYDVETNVQSSQWMG